MKEFVHGFQISAPVGKSEIALELCSQAKLGEKTEDKIL
jgi:hypothetical protein